MKALTPEKAKEEESPPAPNLRRKLSDSSDKQPPKKIILNRNTVVLEKDNKKEGKENNDKMGETDADGASATGSAGKILPASDKPNVIKVGSLNVQEVS